jgi:hypothetical protein
MAKLIYGLTVQRILTDRETNSVSYIEVVDGFNVPALPVPLPPFLVGTAWEPMEGEVDLQVRISFMGPDNKVQHFQGRNRHRVNVNFTGVPVAVAGEYFVSIEQKRGGNWKEEERLKLAINYVPQQPRFAIQQDKAPIPLRQS